MSRPAPRRLTALASLALSVVVAGALAACDDDVRTITEVVTRTDTLRRTDTVRITVRDTVRFGNTVVAFDQIERLANPLVSEVFVDKREHGHYNTSVPSEDRAQFADDIAGFVRTVAGRAQGVADALAATLVGDFARGGGATGGGDMLVVFMDRAPGVTAAVANDPANAAGAVVGWLTYLPVPPLAGATGWGGRKLRGDDTVDKGLLAVFGPLLDAANVSPGLATDNVGANDRAPLATFPYLPEPNAP